MSSILAMTTLSIAQLVEQRTVVPLVTGSSPVAEICLHGPMDKAPAYGVGDFWVRIPVEVDYLIHTHTHTHIVSMPERSKGSRLGRDVAKRVGSNPTADKAILSEWSKEPVSSTGSESCAGSNPADSTQTPWSNLPS